MMRQNAHINPRQRSDLRRRLLARGHELNDEIESGLRSRRLHEEPFDAPSIGEAAVAISDVQRDAGELREVVAALARIDTGVYGLCVDCGSPLPFVRLDAVPHAARCIDCEKQHERAGASPVSL